MTHKPANKFRSPAKKLMIWVFTSLGIFPIGNSVITGQELSDLNRSNTRVAFYNVETLFDIYEDSLTSNEEYTPEGTPH